MNFLPAELQSHDLPDAPPAPRITWSQFETEHPDEATAAENEVLMERQFREFMEAGSEEFHAAALVLRQEFRAARRGAVERLGYELVKERKVR